MNTQQLSEFVYGETYQASLVVMHWVVPYLPPDANETFSSRLEGLATAVPRLIATAALRRARVSCTELEVILQQCRDLFPREVNRTLCNRLIDIYRRSSDALQETAPQKKCENGNAGGTP